MVDPRGGRWNGGIVRIWQASGAWTVALAIGHLATTTLFYDDSVRSLLDGGVVGAVDAEPALASLRGAAFWYVTAGLLLGLLGLMVLAEERRRGAPPPGFALLMAITGIWGIVLSPISGFWLFLPIALLSRRHRRRRVDDSGKQPVWPVTTRTVDLPAGPIEYVDTAGSGPVLVFTHGFPMSHTLWRNVIPALTGYRCVAPTLPLGAHRRAMRPGADLSQIGQAHILADFLEALDLRQVTLVMNDWGGPQLLTSIGRADRVSRLVMISCEAFDNFPPRPARPLVNLLRFPGGSALLVRLLAMTATRRHPRALGGLSRRSIPDAVLDEWFEPATTDARVRRDLRRFALGTPSRDELLAHAERLADFTGPVLVVWGAEDRMMPRSHADRLARIFADCQVAIVADAGTLVGEDEPEGLIELLRGFLRRTAHSGPIPPADETTDHARPAPADGPGRKDNP